MLCLFHNAGWDLVLRKTLACDKVVYMNSIAPYYTGEKIFLVCCACKRSIAVMTN